MNGGLLFAALVHDDGAAFHRDSGNVLVYGGVQSNSGFHNAVRGNLLLQPHVNSLFPGGGYDAFNYDGTVRDGDFNSVLDNTVVMKGHACRAPYGSGEEASLDDGPRHFPNASGGNRLLNDEAAWEVFANCGPAAAQGAGCFRRSGSGGGDGCKTFTLQQWQAAGNDNGSSVGAVPPDAAILSMAKGLLLPNLQLRYHHRRPPPQPVPLLPLRPPRQAPPTATSAAPAPALTSAGPG